MIGGLTTGEWMLVLLAIPPFMYYIKKLKIIPPMLEQVSNYWDKKLDTIKKITSIERRILINADGERVPECGCKNALKLKIDSIASIETRIEIKNLSIFDMVVKSIELSMKLGNETIGQMKDTVDIKIKTLDPKCLSISFTEVRPIYDKPENCIDVNGVIVFKWMYWRFKKDIGTLRYAISAKSKERWREHAK